MVKLILFENSPKNQTLRTLIALSMIIPCDTLYTYLSEKSLERIKTHYLAYFSIWLILSIVFGISIIYSEPSITDTPDESYNNNIRNYAYYGVLVGLLICVPMYSWIATYSGNTPIMCLSGAAFGIILSAFVSIMVFLISKKADVL